MERWLVAKSLCYHAHLMAEPTSQQGRKKSSFRVRDYMTATVTSLTVDARLLDAALLIRRTGKRHVPVVSADGKVLGIISDRDVSRLAPSVLSPLSSEDYNKIFESTSVTLAMTKDPVTIHPDAPVQQAVHIMTSKKFSSVLVTEADGKLVGIITVTDLLALLDQLLIAADKQ
ncbi:MAG: CBS domain-containing protein [Terriglobales bacterium]